MNTKTPSSHLGSDMTAKTTAALKEGLIHHQEGRLSEAEKTYREILELDPNHSVALCMLGLIAQAMRQNNQAITLISRSIEINPEFPDAHCNLGTVYLSEGLYNEALKAFDQAIRLKPDYLNGLVYRGITLQKLGQLPAALQSTNQALSLSPKSPQIHIRMAEINQAMGQNQNAINHCHSALAANQTFIPAFEMKAVILHNLGKTREAIALYDTAISINDQVASLHNNKGNCLLNLERYDEALSCFTQALTIQPNYASAYSNRGVLKRLRGSYQEAEQDLRKAIEIDAEYAEAHQNLSFTLMNQGQVREALEEYEWRWQTPNWAFPFRKYAKPLWDGTQDISQKTLMLWPEQGPGDIVIWASAFSEVIDKCKHCIISVYPKLVPLFRRSFPNADVREDNGAYDPAQNDFDYHVPMGSLFKCLQIDPAASQTRFLTPDPERVAFWRSRLDTLGSGPFIGMSWKGALITDARAPNYTRIADWEPMMRMPATYVNLQCGEREADLHLFRQQFGITIHDFDDLDLYDDLDDVAAFCQALDVAISVSTAVAPIAAGVGTKTWLLAWQQSPWNNFLLKARGPEVISMERATDETWHNSFETMTRLLAPLTQPQT